MGSISTPNTEIDVAIVGGGIAGLTLALTLQQQGITPTIYELRETSDVANPGAIALAPNALRPLVRLGLYEQIRAVSWPLHSFQFRNESDELSFSFSLGDSDTNGFHALRVVRRRLHNILLTAVHEAKINLVTGKKFSHVVTSGANGITFAFTDSTQTRADLLVGADGIHSAVRAHIAPGIAPQYQNNLALACKITHNPLLDLLRTPDLDDRLHSITMTNGHHSAFLSAIQSPDGHECSLGLDRRFPDQSREEWDALLADKHRQHALFMEHLDSWPPLIQMQMRAVTPDDMYRSWPYFALPDLERWVSGDGRAVVIGDAAHAIPPSAGQGAGQAIEDAWSLGLVLAERRRAPGDGNGLDEWQTMRKARIARVRDLTRRMANARLPKEARDAMGTDEYVTAESVDLDWLYGYEYGSAGS